MNFHSDFFTLEIESHGDKDNGDPLDFPESVDDSKDKPSPMSGVAVI